MGKTIQIYYPSGEPRGIRIAEITTRIVQAVVVPRALLKDAATREELAGSGFYFLFGESEETNEPLAYIGEADDCLARLKQHQNKTFWNIAVAIVSRTGSFTKAHGLLLERKAIAIAKDVNRYQLDNGNDGRNTNSPEWLMSDADEIFDTAEILLGALGFPIFEALNTKAEDPEQPVFHCRRGGADARGIYGDEGFVVLAGSLARKEITPSASNSLVKMRDRLVEKGKLREVDGGFEFTADEQFSSPSTAAQVCVGGNSNGWLEWKDASGKTLDDVYRSV